MNSVQIIQELNELYDFYLEIKNCNHILEKKTKSYTTNGKTIKLRTTSNFPFMTHYYTTFLINYYNMTNLPLKLDNEDYENLDALTIYRGDKSVEYVKNLIQDEIYHTGDGTFGNGIYISPDIRFAADYANLQDKKHSGILVEYKLMTNSKIITNELLQKLRNSIKSALLGDEINLSDEDYDKEKLFALISFLDNKNDNDFTTCFTSENSNALALYLGYDALYGNDNEIVIFNRHKLCISQREYNKILRKAEEEKFKMQQLPTGNDNSDFSM